MTSPVVDVARDIPLKTERNFYKSDDETGFPFDKDFDRNRDRDTQGRFRSQLDDLAKRIPEFAEHFPSGFPFTSRAARSSDDPEFRRFTEEFPAGFEEFGFPFNRDSPRSQHFQQQPPPEYHQQQPPPEYYQQKRHSQDNPQQQYYQEPAQEFYQPPPPPQDYYGQNPQQPEPSSSRQEEPAPAEDKKNSNNLQQSNTVDLGQQQEPVNDRNQRSMSAPPDNRPRFKSSINIPMNSQEPQAESMPQQQQQQQSGKPVERVIPIHIEGRDDPVIPKTTVPNFSKPSSGFGHHPEPETIFGRRPDYYKQFCNQDPRQDWPPQEHFTRQHVPPQFQSQPQQRQYQYAAPKQQQSPPQQKAQQPPPQPQQQQQPQPPQPQAQAPPQPQPQKQATPPPQAPQKPMTAIEQIQAIRKDVNELMEQVEKFGGKPRDKQYLYLDEMLTRNMLKLDNIDTQGQETIKTARKEAIKFIEKCIGNLECKAAANVAEKSDNMEVENKPEDNEASEQAQPMETEAAAGPEEKPADEKAVEEKPAESMEVEAEAGANSSTEVPDDKKAVLVNEEPPSEAEKAAEDQPETKNEADSAESQKGSGEKKEKKKGKKKADK